MLQETEIAKACLSGDKFAHMDSFHLGMEGGGSVQLPLSYEENRHTGMTRQRSIAVSQTFISLAKDNSMKLLIDLDLMTSSV